MEARLSAQEIENAKSTARRGVTPWILSNGQYVGLPNHQVQVGALSEVKKGEETVGFSIEATEFAKGKLQIKWSLTSDIKGTIQSGLVTKKQGFRAF